VTTGEWRAPRWLSAGKDGDVRIAYAHLDGVTTLRHLLEHVAEVAPNASHDEVTVSGVHLSWTRQATEEELAERERFRVAQEERHAAWQRRVMRSLIEQYGPDTTTWPYGRAEP
jgi:hypothetical protein